MTHHLPLQDSDIPTVARFIHLSSLQQATNRFVFKDWPAEKTQIAFFERNLRKAGVRGWKAVSGEGEVVGAVMFSREEVKGAGMENRDEQVAGKGRVVEGREGLNLEFLSVFRGALMGAQRGLEGVDHLVLDFIFVSPSLRNKGLGTQLVDLCLEKAKEEKLPLKVCSVPSAVGFYRRLGFREIGFADLDLAVWGPEKGGFGVYRFWGLVYGEYESEGV
ncbi:acyl-CoA N-acyltransferase [Mollisia scopiformis]|uniref:Acyl-CoA N-acyltransferase n=1 Tax=Mollisia scopiformis TaxID=149040 RepID=A0A194WW45_MOLSC|nr:acyl-CoA N-acyltransferase [Mollisia scopiformis]KUJ12188.1 acyl-CoA N-acyltransferase [Mollisia scopiformis]